MYGIPEKYKKEIIINKEKFIPKSETTQNKKKIRDSLKKVKLKYQIDDDIPNLIDEYYNVQVIMILEVELKCVKYLEYINEVFQKLLKGYVIIVYKYDNEISLGYGYKRVNKQDSNDIVLEDSFVTSLYEEVFLLDNYILYEKYLNFKNIKNRSNKLEFYIESMIKAYTVSNRNYFRLYKKILDSNLYYSLESMLKLYVILKELIYINKKLSNKNITVEKIELNKRIVYLNKELEGLLDAKY